MTRKIILHESGLNNPNGAWDVFSDDPDDTAESLGLYDSAGCKIAMRFAKKHPKLRYVGSEDNEHIYPNHPPEEIPMTVEKIRSQLPELKVLDERTFHFYKDLTIRHYNDHTWEILDEKMLPIIQGKCGQTVEQDFAEIAFREGPFREGAKVER